MSPKEIGRAAGKLFEAQIPPNVAIRPQEDQEDYGIDYELELTEPTDRATGFIFKVQQKGVENASYISKDTRLSFSDLKVARMRYYLTQIRIPVLFIVVDLHRRAVLWTRLQGNPSIHKAYEDAVAARSETMTVHLPVENKLPETYEQMLTAVRDSLNWLLVRGIQNASPISLLQAAAGKDFEASASAFSRQNDIFRLEQIERLLKVGKSQEAFQTAEKIFHSEAETVGMRFAAVINLLRIKPTITTDANSPNRSEEITNYRKVVTRRLFQLTLARGTDRVFRLYALFLCRAAELNELVQNDFGLYLTKRVQMETSDEAVYGVTELMRTQTAFAAQLKFSTVQHAFAWIIQKHHYHLVVWTWAQMVQDVRPLLARLRDENLSDAADALYVWLDQTGEVALEIANVFKNWGDVGYCALQSISLEQGVDQGHIEARFARARKTIEAIPDAGARDKALSRLTQLQMQLAQPRTDESFADYYRQMAVSLGINLGDERDPNARIINIGIRDISPERVLKHCRFLHVQLQRPGALAQTMALPTAAAKTLRCIKSGQSVTEEDLDTAFEAMRKNCAKCGSCEPHPAEWKWSQEWQAQEDLKLAESRSGEG